MTQPKAVGPVNSLDPLFDGFKEYLVATGLAPATVDYQLRIGSRFGRWLESTGRPLKLMDEGDVESFIAAQQRRTYARLRHGAVAAAGVPAECRKGPRPTGGSSADARSGG
ncbi:hypothetical protein GCM10027562_21890 [Arthrobacter pigmenti]